MIATDVDIDLSAGIVIEVMVKMRGIVGYRPNAREIREAGDLISQYGEDDVLAALPILIQLLKENWPDAKRWGATLHYWPDAIATYRAVQMARQRKEANQNGLLSQRADSERSDEEARLDRERQQKRWDVLPAADKQRIERKIRIAHPRYESAQFRLACLAEMDRRHPDGVLPNSEFVRQLAGEVSH